MIFSDLDNHLNSIVNHSQIENMQKYIDIIGGAYSGYWNYLVFEIFNPSWHNYFWWLIGVSILVCMLEFAFPWRKNQPKIGNDFFLDIFYTFWNYFLFSLIAYNALSLIGVELFKDFLGLFGIENIIAIRIEMWPFWLRIVFIFIFRDLMQYFIHRMLHRFDWMWEFHKVHHSSTEMGFGALMRYHFMENIIYRSCEYIPLAMLGLGLTDFFMVHITTLLLGQIGHANLYIPLGKLKYLLNGPQMHLLHHSKHFPDSHPKGFNFGISLSIWDFIFKTNYWPKDDAYLIVGLPDEDTLPKSFIGQIIVPFKKIFR